MTFIVSVKDESVAWRKATEMTIPYVAQLDLMAGLFISML